MQGLDRASAAKLRRAEGTRLARSFTKYVGHLREHMRHEERVFYASAESVLNAADWRALAADAVPNDPLADSAQLTREYPALARHLALSVRTLSSDGRARVDLHPKPSRDRATRLVELYGELLHDGFDLMRESVHSAGSLRNPLDLWRVAAPIFVRSGTFAMRCVTQPAHFAQETLQEVAEAARSAWRPASGKR